MVATIEPHAGRTADAVQAEVEAWIDEHWDPALTVREWWSKLATAGLSYSMLAPPYGRGYSREQNAAVFAALRAKGAMGPPAGIGTMLSLPTILTHGTPEQIEQFVPRIIDGTHGWCQLFSEPGAGSDLAGLQTRAERDGDEWVVTGQKVWTSTGQAADYGILIARTDPSAPKHQGITYFLMPMRQPGVDVRPLREMTGHAVFNEVFLDGARVPDSLRLGDLGAGWAVANTTLSHERAGIGEASGGFGRAAPGSIVGHLDRPCSDFLDKARAQMTQGHISPGTVKRFIELAREAGRLEDPMIRQAIADLHTRVQVMGWSARRAKGGAGGRTGVEGPLAKIGMTGTLRRGVELGCAILGPDAQLWGRDAATSGWFQELMVFSPAPGIYGGTDEIQRNIIGERGLGLPKEPGHPREMPFKDLPANATR
ncbi:MAG: acyl-CoA dehydrogenase family protein [Thermoleophilia bacterium]|nr:acyl-CoA dehydrogenase family protein [Thermoleophilia bacterium]